MSHGGLPDKRPLRIAGAGAAEGDEGVEDFGDHGGVGDDSRLAAFLWKAIREELPKASNFGIKRFFQF